MMSTASAFLFLFVIFTADFFCFEVVCILLTTVEQAMNFRQMF